MENFGVHVMRYVMSSSAIFCMLHYVLHVLICMKLQVSFVFNCDMNYSNFLFRLMFRRMCKIICSKYMQYLEIMPKHTHYNKCLELSYKK
jgi:hypothetical protein